MSSFSVCWVLLPVQIYFVSSYHLDGSFIPSFTSFLAAIQCLYAAEGGLSLVDNISAEHEQFQPRIIIRRCLGRSKQSSGFRYVWPRVFSYSSALLSQSLPHHQCTSNSTISCSVVEHKRRRQRTEFTKSLLLRLLPTQVLQLPSPRRPSERSQEGTNAREEGTEFACIISSTQLRQHCVFAPSWICSPVTGDQSTLIGASEVERDPSQQQKVWKKLARAEARLPGG